MTNDCLFCKIINKEIPAAIVYENDEVVAFLDIKPVSPGHALVVPKKHSIDMLDTDDLMLGELAAAAKKIGQAQMATLGYEGFNIGVNNGAAAHQIIMHAHWHVIPRRSNDGLIHWPHKDYMQGEMEDIAEKIINSLK